MRLHADIGLRLGAFEVDLAVEVADGEVVALLGPNGSGKTTTLRAIAGLLPIDRGRIVAGDQVLDDPAVGVLVPARDRPVGLVFQDHLLFPHLTARDNVAFGLRAAGEPKGRALAEATRWLDHLGVGDLADVRPATLSGGQAQRVALARTLATRPAVLLLDEPLAALDASVRGSIRAELRRHLTAFGGARLLVTHDPVDALVLADRLVVVEEGRVVQAGTGDEVAARPRSPFVADLVGVNLLHGTAHGETTVRLGSGHELTVLGPLPGAAVDLVIRPRAVALHLDQPEGSPRNTWRATVRDVLVQDDRARVSLDGPVPVAAEVTTASVADLSLRPGVAVWASVKAVDIDAYER